MILNTPGKDGASRESLELAEEQFTRAIRALRAAARQLEEGGASMAADIQKDARLLSGAIQMLAKEKQKIEDSIREEDAIACGYAIDLAAAREEIRRRLDRLRAARGGGEISG